MTIQAARRPTTSIRIDASGESDLVCPACHEDLASLERGRSCVKCDRFYPLVAGLLDLRLQSDRYLDLESERAVAQELAAIEASTNAIGLAERYFSSRPEVKGRGAMFLAHVESAIDRGETLADLLPGEGRVLEVGCGTGGMLVAARRRGITIEGLDIAARRLVIARRRLKDHHIHVPLILAQAERSPYRTGSFDTVVLDSVVEHLTDPFAAFRECARVLKPGGRLIVWSPNRYSIIKDPHVGLWGVGFLPRRLLRRYVAFRRGAIEPIACLSARETKNLAMAAGFRSIAIEPPRIDADWSKNRSFLRKILMWIYRTARISSPTKTLALAFGPLWSLTAIRGENSCR